jgi:hypothetical protein
MNLPIFSSQHNICIYVCFPLFSSTSPFAKPCFNLNHSRKIKVKEFLVLLPAMQIYHSMPIFASSMMLHCQKESAVPKMLVFCIAFRSTNSFLSGS